MSIVPKIPSKISNLPQKPLQFFVVALSFVAVIAVCIALGAFSSPPKQNLQQTQQSADEASLPKYVVKKALETILIDGNLSEDSWKKAVEITDFMLTEDAGKPENKTSVRLLWDNTNLYVAFECADTDIIARMMQRDDKLWEEEVVEIFFAPYSPEKFGYTELEISPANTILDLYVREVRGVMPVALPYSTYNLSIRSATQIRGTLNNSGDKDTSWTVELALPLAEIQPVNLTPITPGDTWKMNFYRMERFPKKELIAWSPTMINKFHVPMRFGTVIFSEKRAGE